MAKSMNSLRQIGIWMQAYSSDNREFILPSQFDYSNNPYTGKVRSGHRDHRRRAPGDVDRHPLDDPRPRRSRGFQRLGVDVSLRLAGCRVLRSGSSTSTATRCVHPPRTRESRPAASWRPTHAVRARGRGSRRARLLRRQRLLRRPAGSLRSHRARRRRWYTNGQIARPRPLDVPGGLLRRRDDCRRAPRRSTATAAPDTLIRCEVDFRYNGLCLMLFLDGHVSPEATWRDLERAADQAVRSRLQGPRPRRLNWTPRAVHPRDRPEHTARAVR